MNRVLRLLDETSKKLGLKQKTDNEQFEEICKKIVRLHEKKSQDYGSTFSKVYELYGSTYPQIMIMSKILRINNLQDCKEVNNESVVDSYMDIASYAIMAIIEQNNKSL